MNQPLSTTIAELEQSRESKVLIYHAGDGRQKTIDGQDAGIIFQALRTMGRIKKLDFFLQTEGGFLCDARRIAILLRDHCEHLTIFVTHKAYSAGTLLCLGANELVLGPLAELSPIDPSTSSGRQIATDVPKNISSEEIRAFVRMSRNWFGMKKQSGHILDLLIQRIFPTSLSSIYLTEEYTERICRELLNRQLPRAKPAEIQTIMSELMARGLIHAHRFTREDILKLRLNARPADETEESQMWAIHTACRSYFDSEAQVLSSDQTRTNSHCIVVGKEFRARYVMRFARWNPGATEPPSILYAGWETGDHQEPK